MLGDIPGLMLGPTLGAIDGLEYLVVEGIEGVEVKEVGALGLTESETLKDFEIIPEERGVILGGVETTVL